MAERERWLKRTVAAIVTLLLAGGMIALGAPASAAGTATVTITPAATTVVSGTPVTYTLSITCQVTDAASCTDTTVSFPATTITGNGTVTDFSSWFGGSSCPGVTRSVSGGNVIYNFGTVANGTRQCTITVTPAPWRTLDGTQATLTPTIAGTNFTSSTGASATLNVTARALGSFTKNAAVTVGTGAGLAYTLRIDCGAARGCLCDRAGLLFGRAGLRARKRA